MKPTLRLELGKWYETRDGRSAQIIAYNNTDIWEWDGILDGRVEQWRCDGRYYGAHGDCAADLVKEIEPPKTINHD